jgi:sigma-B regulation protein RsbU (phosphoserine phosphatase)
MPAWLNTRSVLLVGIVFTILMVAAALAFLWWERKGAISDALASAEILAQALEEESNRAIDTSSILLKAFSEEVKQDTPHLDRMLSQMIAGAPFVRSVSLVSTDGVIFASSSQGNRGCRLDVTQLPDVQSGAKPGAELTLGKPVLGRDLCDSTLQIGHKAATPLPLHFLPLARSVKWTNGDMVHLVVALNTDYLSNYFHLMLDKTGSIATLLDYNGDVIASSDDARTEYGVHLSFGREIDHATQ